MTARGFTIVELLAAMAVMLVLLAALATLTFPMQRSFDRSLAGAEVVGRARTAINSVAAEIRDAGAGAQLATLPQSLAAVLPVVVPARSLTDPRAVAPLTAVTVTRVVGGQAVLAELALAGTTLLRMDSSRPSIEQDGTGGFRAGDLAVVFSPSRAQIVTIAQVTAATWSLTIASPLASDFDRWAVIAGITRNVFGLRANADGTNRLVRISAGGAEQPVVDAVERFELTCWVSPSPSTPTDPATIGEITAAQLNDGPWYPDPSDPAGFDVDLLRVRRVDIDLRLPAVPATIRPFVPVMDLESAVALRSR